MNTSKLKAAAEKVRWVDWSAYKPHSGARGYEVRVGSEAVAQHCLKDDAAFIAEASPKAVLCLIEALEAKDAQIAELLEKQRLIDICQGQGLEHRIAAERRAEAAEKRVAELERQAIQPLPIGELISRLEEQTGEPWGEVYLAGINLRRGESDHG